MCRLKQYSALVFCSYLVAWLYYAISQFWAEQGGASGTLNHFEFPLVVLLCLVLYFSPVHNRKIFSFCTFAPVLTIVGWYIIYDIVYMYFARSPRLSDVENIILLLKVSVFMFVALLALFVLAFLPTIVAGVRWFVSARGRSRGVVLVVKSIALVLIFYAITSSPMYSYQTQRLSFVEWSDTRNVIKNGRIGAFIYYHNKRQDFVRQLGLAEELSIKEALFSRKPRSKKNIHIIVLESFIDPRKIEGLTFDRSPVGEKLQPFLQGGDRFDTIETTVYGGGSPQSEFEILTGIPALALLSGIEFNLFEGTPTNSFVSALKEEGYYSMVAKGSKTGFYNSSVAYKGIGFDESHYLDARSYYDKQQGDDYLFDGDLLAANIDYVQRYFKSNKKLPLLNYVVGMFGHLPFDRNKQRRPDVIHVASGNTLFTDLANQFYYRTNALGDYLAALKRMDPEAIVFICSDHLPPIISKKHPYTEKNRMVNIGLLFDGFERVDIRGKRYFEIPHLVWGLLQDKGSVSPQYSPLATHELKKKLYLTFIAQAMGMASSE